MRERPGATTSSPSTALLDPDLGVDGATEVSLVEASFPEDCVMSHLRAADAAPDHDDSLRLRAAGEVDDWRELGECRGADLSLFYPEDDDDLGAELAAKAICAACAVREHCLEQALDSRERVGVWGGLSPRERRRILRRRRREAA